MEVKVCHKCNIEFPRTSEYFYRSKNVKDGLDYQCKNCKLETSKKYQSNNREKIKQSKKERYDPAKQKKIRLNYYSKNRKSILKKRKDTYVHSRNLRCYLRGLISSTKANSKKKKLSHTLNTDLLLQVLNNQNNKCALTGLEMTYISGQGIVETNISVDRIDPSKGYTPDNIWLVCLQANQMKTNMTVEKLLKTCKYILENVTPPSF